MGRAGIKKRKPGTKPQKNRRETDAWPGVLEDLYDQAEWSSYGQDIPRLGNPYRERILWGRRIRTFATIGYLRRARPFSRRWWLGLGTLLLLVPTLTALFFAVVYSFVLFLRSLLH